MDSRLFGHEIVSEQRIKGMWRVEMIRTAPGWLGRGEGCDLHHGRAIQKAYATAGESYEAYLAQHRAAMRR